MHPFLFVFPFLISISQGFFVRTFAKRSLCVFHSTDENPYNRRYSIQPPSYYEQVLKRLNSRNYTIREEAILGKYNPFYNEQDNTKNSKQNQTQHQQQPITRGYQIIISKNGLIIHNPYARDMETQDARNEEEDDEDGPEGLTEAVGSEQIAHVGMTP